MTTPSVEHLVILGVIATLTQEQQDLIKDKAQKIRELVQTDEDKIALALVGAELSGD